MSTEHFPDCDGNCWVDCHACSGTGEVCACWDDWGDCDVGGCPDPLACDECDGRGGFACHVSLEIGHDPTG